jgi:hypothetical protein
MPFKSKKKQSKYYSIYNWKRYGLIDSDNDNYEKLYDKYIHTEFCELCNVKLTSGNEKTTKRCMDHDHKTGLFRNITCMKCNSKLGVKEALPKSTTGIKNITQMRKNQYRYKTMINGVIYRKYFNTLGGALAHKIIHNVLNKK